MEKIVNGNPPPFVRIIHKKGFIEVTWGYTTLWKQSDTGKFSCYIPAFDMYFSASDAEMREKKSRAMTTIFFDHFFIHNKEKALKILALELNKRGFKTNTHNHDMAVLVKNKPINAKFNANVTMPDGYSKVNSVHSEYEMEIAS
jgi:hypothetical protein